MKCIKYIVSFFALLLATSCGSLLDLSPEDYYGSGNFWNTEAQVKGFMLGLHNQYRGSYSMYYILGEARGGTSRNGTSSQNTSLDYSSPIKDNTFTKDKTGISSWNGLYSNLLQVNLFIQKVNEVNFLDAATKSYLLGQAHGLRANYYFMLYKTYGGVPIVERVKVLDGQITAESLYQARATAQETMDFIKKDLKISEENFGANVTINGNKSQWSKYATLMLKAEVYLWTAKVSTGNLQANPSDALIAKDALNEVYGKFELMKSFTDVFSEKGNKEVIFALRFMDGEATNFASSFTYSNNVFLGQVYGRKGNLIDTDTLQLKNSGMMRNEYKWGLFASMDEKDVRRDATFLDYYDQEGNPKGLAFKKCIGIINQEGNRVYQNDIIVYRYADVLLMLAEIENMTGGDVSPYINQIRERAYAANWDENQFGYKNGSKDENEFAILFERDKEFIWEGKRWFDVVRMKNGAGESLVFDARANYDDPNPILTKDQAYMILWPIDINTLNNDPELKNNPGYGN